MKAPAGLSGVRGIVARILRRLLQLAEGTPDRPFFEAGIRAEWEDFARRNRAVLHRFPSLKAAVIAAFVGKGSSQEDADVVIFFLGRLAAEDFGEIVLLCANGYGFGATKLLRGMYERVVTARYLRLRPDEAEAFLVWGVVSEGKRAQEVLDTFGDGFSAATVTKLKEKVAEGKAERPRFMVPDCKTCSTTRLNHTWSRLDMVAMARARLTPRPGSGSSRAT